MATLILHLGSNLGNRQKNLDAAILLIEENVGLLTNQSSVYETAVWLGKDRHQLPEVLRKQAPFLNIALQVNTALKPIKALELCLNIEQKLGRVRQLKWGPRSIDIDLIFYDEIVLNTTKLILPHPWMQYRRFVLKPLVEIIADWVHPVLEQSVEELLEVCEDEGVVDRIGVVE